MVRRSFFVFGESIFFFFSGEALALRTEKNKNMHRPKFLGKLLPPDSGLRIKKTCTVFKLFAVGPENYTNKQKNMHRLQILCRRTGKFHKKKQKLFYIKNARSPFGSEARLVKPKKKRKREFFLAVKNLCLTYKIYPSLEKRERGKNKMRLFYFNKLNSCSERPLCFIRFKVFI